MKLNPYVRYLATHQYFVNKKHDSVCLDCRLFYVEEGNGRIKIDNHEYKIEKHTLIYLPPNTAYNFNYDQNKVKIHLFNFDLVDEFSNYDKPLPLQRSPYNIEDNPVKYEISNQFNKVIIEKHPTLLNEISSLVECFKQKDDFYQEICSAKLKLILIKIIKNLDDSTSNSVIKEVINVIKKEYGDASLTNEKIAVRFNYHPYHLNKIFKAETGVSLHKYLLNYRLELSKYYLITTANSITDISENVGFSNYSYFIKSFRERYNLSPLRFRKQNLEI